MILNLGCGNDRKEGAVNVDKINTPAVDKLWDLDELPWPWPDRSVERIYAIDVLEHLSDLMAAMEEVWRLLVPAGVLEVKVPDGSGPNLWRDPTHRRGFALETFDFFDPETFFGGKCDYYSRAKFKIIGREKRGDDLYFKMLKRNMHKGNIL